MRVIEVAPLVEVFISLCRATRLLKVNPRHETLNPKPYTLNLPRVKCAKARNGGPRGYSVSSGVLKGGGFRFNGGMYPKIPSTPHR